MSKKQRVSSVLAAATLHSITLGVTWRMSKGTAPT